MDFISSVIAGLLIGIGLDWWLGTQPIFVVIGIVILAILLLLGLLGAWAGLRTSASAEGRRLTILALVWLLGTLLVLVLLLLTLEWASRRRRELR